MKINQLIAKGLSIGLLLNSLSILSYANTEIPNRYQTLEGEYVTIDDSIEGNLEEIEIFGNTVQDENNLEDIQSAGDLYVDENGNPILDKQGREQYKIDVNIRNDNIFDINASKRGHLNYSTGNVTYSDSSSDIVSDFIKLSNTNGLYFYGEILGGNTNHQFYMCFYDKDKNYLGFNQIQYVYFKERVYRPNPDTEYVRIGYNPSILSNFRMSEGGNFLNSHVESQSQTQTILLPCQLMKVGDVMDKLYWDSTKNKYIIEKNIGEYTVDSNSPIATTYLHNNYPDTIGFSVRNNYFQWNSKLMVTKLKYDGTRPISAGTLCSNEEKIFVSDYIFVTLNKTKLESLDVNGVRKYLKDNSIKIYGNISNPEYMETNITSKLKMSTYEEKTYVFTETKNGINPTLKVTVDRLPQIAKEAVIQAETDSTNFNISLARMYTNTLPESLYKDQLQDQLSKIFSSDIVLDKKSVTSNLDLYIKCENILQMSLSTNNITFEDFSGVEDMTKENAVQISINSSLPYSLNAYLPTEIQNSDKSVVMDKSILNIKENSENSYQTFANTTDKIILKDNNQAGNDLIHNVDIKLKGGIAHQKDVYKTTIKFEAEQK